MRKAGVEAAKWLLFAGLLGLLISGCPEKPSAPSSNLGGCVEQALGSDLVQQNYSSAIVAGHQFTLNIFTTLEAWGASPKGAFETHVIVERDSLVALELDEQMSATGKLLIHVHQGDGFRGAREAVFTVTDHQTLVGKLDGRAISPLSIHSKPTAVTFADGTPIPVESIDDDVKEALPILTREAQRACPGVKAPSKLAITTTPGIANDTGHPSFPDGSTACTSCIGAATGGEFVCIAAGIAASVACLAFYPVCLAIAEAACFLTYYETLVGVCHVVSLGGGGGAPCCPVAAGGNSCCELGETPVGTQGFCCSPGLKACGENNCCSPTDTCMGSGECCPGQSVCGNACCGSGQTCVNINSSTCCAGAHACGESCCSKNESCTDPNHGTCAACNNCTGAGDECCFGQCCGAGQYCNTDSRRCDCLPNCTDKCGGAPDGCGGLCAATCAAPQVCFEQKCCQPDCVGKCGAASDGCGSTCGSAAAGCASATGCPSGQECQGNKCQPPPPPPTFPCCCANNLRTGYPLTRAACVAVCTHSGQGGIGVCP